jgi:hypothetical protein
MKLARLFATGLVLFGTSGCCCFRPSTYGTAYAPPAYSTPPVYQAPAVVQQAPPAVQVQSVQPTTYVQPSYVQAQTVCQPVVCQPVCNPCCPQ